MNDVRTHDVRTIPRRQWLAVTGGLAGLIALGHARLKTAAFAQATQGRNGSYASAAEVEVP